jgi:hypothetical protein
VNVRSRGRTTALALVAFAIGAGVLGDGAASARAALGVPTPLPKAGGGAPTPPKATDEAVYPVATVLNASLRWNDGSSAAHLGAVTAAVATIVTDGASRVELNWLVDGKVVESVVGISHDPSDSVTFERPASVFPKTGSHSVAFAIANLGSSEGHEKFVAPAAITYDVGGAVATPVPSATAAPTAGTPVDALQFQGFLLKSLHVTSKNANAITGTGSGTIGGSVFEASFAGVRYTVVATKDGKVGDVTSGNGSLLLGATSKSASDAVAPNETSDFCDPFVRSTHLAGLALRVRSVAYKRFGYDLGLVGLTLNPLGAQTPSRAALCYFPGMQTTSLETGAVDAYMQRGMTQAQKNVGIDAATCEPNAAKQKQNHKPLCHITIPQGAQLADAQSGIQTLVDGASVGIALRNVPIESGGGFTLDVDGSRIPELNLSQRPLFVTTPNAASAMHLKLADGTSDPHVTYDATAQGTFLIEQNDPAPFAGLVAIAPNGNVDVQLHPSADVALVLAALHVKSATLKIAASKFLGGPIDAAYVVTPASATSGGAAGAAVSLPFTSNVTTSGAIDATVPGVSGLASGAFAIDAPSGRLRLTGSGDAFDANVSPQTFMKDVAPGDSGAVASAWKSKTVEGVTFARGTVRTPYGSSLAFDANAASGFGYAALSYGLVCWSASGAVSGTANEADGFTAQATSFAAVVNGTSFVADVLATLAIPAPVDAHVPARFSGLAPDGTLSQGIVASGTSIVLHAWNATLTLDAPAATQPGALAIGATRVAFAGLPSALASVDAAGSLGSDGSVLGGAFSPLAGTPAVPVASLAFTTTAYEFTSGANAAGLGGTFAVPGWQPTDTALAHLTASGGALAPVAGTTLALSRTLGNGGASASAALAYRSGASWSGLGRMQDGHSLDVAFGLAVDAGGMRGAIGSSAGDLVGSATSGASKAVGKIVQSNVKGLAAFASDGSFSGLQNASSELDVGDMHLSNSSISLGPVGDASADACAGHVCINADLNYQFGGDVAFVGKSSIDIVDGVQATISGNMITPVICGPKDASGNCTGIGVAGQLDYYEDTGDWDLGFAASSIPIWASPDINGSAAICLWSHSSSPGSCKVYPNGAGPAFVGKGVGLYFGLDVDIGVATIGGEMDGSVSSSGVFNLHEHASGSFEVFDVGLEVDVDLGYGNSPSRLTGSIDAYVCFCECVGVGGDIVVDRGGVHPSVHLRRKACIGFL